MIFGRLNNKFNREHTISNELGLVIETKGSIDGSGIVYVVFFKSLITKLPKSHRDFIDQTKDGLWYIHETWFEQVIPFPEEERKIIDAWNEYREVLMLRKVVCL